MIDENLDDKIMKLNVLHQLFHVLGRFHEHQRKDRDRYVTIKWDNILPGAVRIINVYNTSTRLLILFCIEKELHSSLYINNTFLLCL